MALTPGTRLGVYEITAQIGEGGMGQVYRATDTKLKRQVAIKILPPSLAADPERLARFQREAEVLASLNHPNIAIIHGLEEADGVKALVMELVEGDDLSEKLKVRSEKGKWPRSAGLTLDEALPIAKQIADALEAAHEQHIIHRDLKPANIKVRADGVVKVLDFGLAKAMESPNVMSASVSQAPTITTPAMMTGVGMILGTAAYMSPEQAKGRTVDRRADVWAFGAVLFEMLTGQRAFGGDDVSEVLSRVLQREPEWGALPPGLSPTLVVYLKRCLHKDAKHRVHDIGDVRLALEGAFETAAPPTTAAPLPARGTPVAWMAALAVAVLGIIAMAVPTLRYLRQTPPASPPEMRTDIVTPATDQPASLALSPDGRQIVFVATGDGASRLWLRPLATTTAQPLAGTEGAQYPFWAPDSRAVAFFADSQLKRIDLGGGAPQTLAPAPTPRGGTWSADGVILFAPSLASPLVRVPASGGPPVALTTLDRQNSHRWPSFLPDGRHFLFYAQGTPDTAGIYLGALDAPAPTRLTAADTAGVYLQTSLAGRASSGPGPAEASREGGWLLWVRAGTLVAQRLDVERPALTGAPVTLADPVMADTNVNVAAVSASAGGLVAYRTGAGTRRQLTWVDRTGKALGTLGAPDENGLLNPSVSPDGHRAVVTRRVQGNADLWLLDGTRTSRFTFDAAPDRNPIWSPDGSRIVFDSPRKGPRDLYQGSASRAGAEALLLASQQNKVATDWSADGRFLIYLSVDPQTNFDLWVVPMEGDRTPWVFLKTPFEELGGTFSPDGRWVAYQSNESGRMEIYVRPFTGAAAPGAGATAAGGQWQVSTAGGIYPRWRSDGRELYYLAPSGAMMAAPIAVTGASVAPGAPVALFPTRIFAGGVDASQGRHYDVTRDGRFLINTVLDEASAPITLLMNWDPEAKR
ncbi:MAG: serine/threonine-protein kinase [Acidobacteria bacterium]|nr:serine/threonine-protein kinase [Acidobacteriota bacterium]